MRVSFQGGAGFQLAGIVDLPNIAPKGMAVFAHCFTCTKDIKVVVRLSRGLAEHGFGVLRFDFTGLGDSLGDFSLTNFSTNQADLQAAISYCASEFQPPQILIGHSFGGACALSIAGQLSNVLGIVTLASPSDTQHLAALLKRKNPAIEQFGSGSVTIGGRNYTITRQMLEDFQRFDLALELSRLEKPVTLFHSPVDETLGFDHALRLYGLLTQRPNNGFQASSTNLICLPGADHLLANNPKDLIFVTDTIAAWFNRLI